MIIPLDVITRKKLVLVKQIYQKALIQSQITYKVVDRMLAIVEFDFANETTLKSIAYALNPAIRLKRNFPEVIEQVESELKKRGKSLYDTTKIQHVHDVRNATQHHARYPSEIEVNDSRTYTRDFLTQTFSDIWGESFESISLVDVVQNTTVKDFLREAESELSKDNFLESVIKCMAGYEYIVGGFVGRITESISPFIHGIGVFRSGHSEIKRDYDVFTAFMRMRDLVAFHSIGINLQEYLKFKRYTRSINLKFGKDNEYFPNLKGTYDPSREEAEYIFSFVTDAIILLESSDEIITQAMTVEDNLPLWI
jgi:hypothetical protein